MEYNLWWAIRPEQKASFSHFNSFDAVLTGGETETLHIKCGFFCIFAWRNAGADINKPTNSARKYE